MTEQPRGGWANPAWGEPTPPTVAAGGAPGYPGSPGYPPPGYGRYGWTAPPVPQPGIVPLRPLGVGEVLDGAITTIRRNPKITIGLALLVGTVQQLFSLVAELSTGAFSGVFNPVASFGASSTSTVGSLSSASVLVLFAGNFVLGTVLGAILTGFLIVVVGEAVLGRQAVAREVWHRVKPRIWALLGGSLLAGLLPVAGVLLAVLIGLAVGSTVGAQAGVPVGIVLGLLMLVLGGYLWGVLALTTPAIVLERLGPVQGLRRSRQLAAPDFWRVFGIRLLATVIAQFLSGLLVLPFTVIGVVVTLLVHSRGGSTGGGVVELLVITALGGVLVGAIVQPFLAGVIGLLYVDRRMRGEGLDIALAESARTTQTSH